MLWISIALSAPLEPSWTLGSETWRAAGPIDVLARAPEAVWAVSGGQVTGLDSRGGRVARFAACPDGGELYPFGTAVVNAAGDRLVVDCGELHFLGLPGGETVALTSGHVGCASMAVQGNRLVVVTATVTPDNFVDFDLRLKVFDVSTGRELSSVASPWTTIAAVGAGFIALSTDDKHIVGLNADLSVRWTRETGVEDLVDNLVATHSRACINTWVSLRCFGLESGALSVYSTPMLEVLGYSEPYQTRLDATDLGVVGDLIWFERDDICYAWTPGSEPVPLPETPLGADAGAWLGWKDMVLHYQHVPRVTPLKPDASPVEDSAEWAHPLWPSLSHDGRFITFVDEKERVWAGPVDGTLSMVATDISAHEPSSISPDGQTVAMEEGLLQVKTGTLVPLRMGEYAVENFQGRYDARGRLFGTGLVDDVESWIEVAPDGQIRPINALSTHWWVMAYSADGSLAYQFDRTYDRTRVVRVETGEVVTASMTPECIGTLTGEVWETCEDGDDGVTFRGKLTEGFVDAVPWSQVYVARGWPTPYVELRRVSDHSVLARTEQDLHEHAAWSGDGKRIALTLSDGRIAVFAL